MPLLLSSASIEINTESVPSSKDLHHLRKRLQEVLNEAAPQVLDELGIFTDNPHIVHVEEIEVEDDQPSFHD